MGSLKNIYIIKLLKSILVISLLIVTTSFGSQTFYNINTIIYGEGKIVPGVNVKVKAGGQKKVKFKPDTLSKLDSVIINNENIGKVEEFVFENVQSNQNISVWFSPIIAETSIVLSKIHTNGRDTVILKDIYVNWHFDTIITTIMNEIVYDTFITISESYLNDLLILTTNDTVFKLDSNNISKDIDTLIYSDHNDMTGISFTGTKDNEIKSGFAAGPNPYIVEQGHLTFQYRANQPILNASLKIYSPLGDILDELDIFKINNTNGVIFKWDGFSSNGNLVKSNSVIAIVMVKLFDGSIVKAKLVVGIKS